MSAMVSIRSSKLARPLWRQPLLWVLVMLGIGLGGLSVLGFQQLQANRDYQQRISKLRSSGIPVDNETLDAHFAANTSKTHTSDWNRACRALDNSWISVLAQELPFVGSGEFPKSALSDGQWADAGLVEDFLERLAPSMTELHALADSIVEVPIWQPMHFDGFATLLGPLQESRSIMNVLLLDYHYALFHRDRNRALRDLKTMRVNVEAYGWKTFFVGELIYLGLVGLHRNAIQVSLQTDIWTEEDLQELIKQVGPSRDLTKVWPKVIASERAMALASLSGSGEYFGETPWMEFAMKLPTARRDYLLAMERASALSTADMQQFLTQAIDFEKSKNRGIVADMLTPAVVGMADALAKSEDDRRLTRLALAVKHFRLSQGRLPNSLAELVQKQTLGITSSDLLTIDQLPLGYSVEGDSAQLVKQIKNYGSPTHPGPLGPVGQVVSSDVVVVR